jgi:hypothetical protein
MFNFIYEDGFKINNNYFPAISRVLYLSTETISKPIKSHETIPLNKKSFRKDKIYSLFFLCCTTHIQEELRDYA